MENRLRNIFKVTLLAITIGLTGTSLSHASDRDCFKAEAKLALSICTKIIESKLLDGQSISKTDLASAYYYRAKANKNTGKNQ